MNRIGFENFRKFKNLKTIEYRPITFLVGRNNAGKSTIVKALLLLHSYFKSSNIYHLSFGNSVLEDANIVTYGRAKYNQAGSNPIKFEYQFDQYLISLSVIGEDDKTYGEVKELTIIDDGLGFKFEFEMLAKSLKITMLDTNEDSKSEYIIDLLQRQLKDIENNLKDKDLRKTERAYIEYVSAKEKLQKTLNELMEMSSRSNSNFHSIEGDFGYGTTLQSLVEELLKSAEAEYNTAFKAIQNGENAPDNFENLKAFKEYGFFNVHAGIFDVFMAYIEQFNLEYIGANPAKQSALFSIRDKNNALAQAIHQFKQLAITQGDPEYRFVKEWMEKFDVGDDYQIKMHAGEAYEMEIFIQNNPVHLADKGMGSIQAMALIMKLACVIRKRKMAEMWDEQFGKERGHTTVIIEEPELNLHPALQSKLADLFWTLFNIYGIHFIIETHSEYILRRSQVLVSENELEVPPNENPFCVHYFPKEYDQLPYQLKYQPDGTFDKNFGSGFFDTASLETLKLLRIKRERKA